ncbi:MAG: hypothetical protein H0X29_06205 [Parachlamydiaceae bacterium]|nr:hypothetical protein [Parachlamydiaceae bacterium]
MRSLYYTGLIVLSLSATACSRNNYDNVVDQTYVHKYGVAVPSEYWTSQGQDGSVISALADGVVVTRSYAAGLQNGETTYTFPHREQIQKKEVYAQGTIVSETEYFLDGSPQQEIVYDPSQGIKTVSVWYIGGTPKSLEKYSGNLLISAEYYTTGNLKDAGVNNYFGTRLVRDDYGMIIATDTIEDGRQKLRTTYHPNNSPKELITYKNGNIDGYKKTFHPAGEPNTIEQWSNDAQHGTTVVFQHGEKFAEIPYANGNKQGIEKRYRDGNALVQEISWDDDQMHGPTISYVGDNAKTDWYYKGNMTTEVNYNFMTNRPPVH